MYHTIFYYDNVGEFNSSILFKCNSKDVFTVIETFEKQNTGKKVVSVTMYDGTQWIKRNFVGWETI